MIDVPMQNPAYMRLGGEATQPARSRPIDLVHLARQTMGDRSVEEQVLSMFAQHACACVDAIADAAGEQRKKSAHALKGSALNVGAFEFAGIAAEIETNPDNEELCHSLRDELNRVKDFISTISR